jgi:hypothetical protein
MRGVLAGVDIVCRGDLGEWGGSSAHSCMFAWSAVVKIEIKEDAATAPRPSVSLNVRSFSS